MPKIILETKIEAPIKVVFDLSRSIDLHKKSTEKTKEEAIAGKTSGLINLNETVTWRAKHLGIYQNLTTKITEFNSPTFFVDEMMEGAFDSFRHEHYFFSEGNNETTMKDVFIYKSPFGLLGKIADFLFLKKYMLKFLEERNSVIKDFSETEEYKSFI